MIRELLIPELRVLVSDLIGRGVKLPPLIAGGVRALEVLDRDPRAEAEPADLLTLTGDQLMDHWRRRSILEATRDPYTGRDAMRDVRGELAGQVAEQMLAAIRGQLDQLLSQLRPDFDEAAKEVRRAVQLGIRPGSSAETMLAMDQPPVTTWRELDRWVKVLDETGRLRVKLVDLLGFAPEPDHWAGNRPPYAACFSRVEPGSWSGGGRTESPRDRWLRLSTYGVVELLPVADTEAAADRVRVIPNVAAAMGATVPGRPRPHADPDDDVFPVADGPEQPSRTPAR